MGVKEGGMKGSGGGSSSRARIAVLVIVMVTVVLAAVMYNQMVNGPAYYCNSEFKATGTCPEGCVEQQCECDDPGEQAAALAEGAACYCCLPV